MNDTSLWVLRGGVATSISDGTLCLFEFEDGCGGPDVELFDEQGPQQDGVTDLGSRLLPRQIVLGLRIVGTDEADLDTRRARFLRLFAPTRAPLQLRFQLANGAVRQIDCKVSRAIPLPSSDRFGPSLKAVVRLRAAEPAFYDPTPVGETWSVGGATGANFTFPITFPITLGSSTINDRRTLSYVGDLDTFPILDIVGPITSPVIRNLTTGAALDFTGTSLGAGERLTIDCRYGAKTVNDQAGANRIAALIEATSDLAGFRLIADPGAETTLNELLVTGSEATTATLIRLHYYKKYLGA